MDLADLRVGEIDLKSGRIARARVKTRKKNPSVVNYLLWPEALVLLRQHLAEGERELSPNSRVFQNSNGQPIVIGVVGTDGSERPVNRILQAGLEKLRRDAESEEVLP